MILVTGATGNVGGELVRALADQGEQVRALVRDPARPLPDGVQPTLGDLDKPESMVAALDGVDAVFLLPGYRDMPGLLAAIRQAGARRVVLLSGGSAGGGDMSNAVSAYMIRSETAVRDSGLAWTLLRPMGFMSNTLRWLPQLRAGDVVRDAFGGVAVANIDPFDIAAVAMAGLLDDAHAGQTYTLSGPQALLPADRLRILGEALDRDLRFEGLSNDEARTQMTASMPLEYVEAFFNFYVDGALDESLVVSTVADLLGRPARTFEQWVAAHIDDFR